MALVPGSAPRVERNAEQDLATVKLAECEYRGIVAPFEELTRAYALSVYDSPQLVRWESRPSPQDPEREALVTAVFTTAGLRPDAAPAAPPILEARRQALPAFGVTWRLNTLAVTRVTAYNEYAKDALLVYQQTVNHFISQMVVTVAAVVLRAGPGPQHAEVAAVTAGTVLLQERAEGGWSSVRIPASSTTGWVEAERLDPIDQGNP